MQIALFISPTDGTDLAGLFSDCLCHQWVLNFSDDFDNSNLDSRLFKFSVPIRISAVIIGDPVNFAFQ